MGSLTIPTGGEVYLDTQAVIYSVERHPDFAAVLRPLWEAAVQAQVRLVTSELTFMETIIGPLRSGDRQLQADYERILFGGEMRLVAVDLDVLREAAALRATVHSLRTPDALHAATARLQHCVQFITNDLGFRQIPGLPLVVLRDLLTQ